jgi:hypothetical protein
MGVIAHLRGDLAGTTRDVSRDHRGHRRATAFVRARVAPIKPGSVFSAFLRAPIWQVTRRAHI